MGSDDKAKNRWFLIAQAQKINVMQVVVFDVLMYGMENHQIHLLSYFQPIAITSIPY